PLRSPLFPYTTLFRSRALDGDAITLAGILGVFRLPHFEMFRKKTEGFVARLSNFCYHVFARKFWAFDFLLNPILLVDLLRDLGLDRKSTRLNSSHLGI